MKEGFLVLVSSLFLMVSIFLSTQASAEEYYVYVDPLPDWASYAGNALYETVTAYEEVNPGLKFYKASTPEEANIVVRWVKDFGGEHIGQTVYGSFIEVGLGDSNCGNKWNPYSADTVTYIMEHEMGHALGLQHSSDPNDIMYYQIQNLQYGKIEDEVNLAAGYYYLHRLCTVKDVTSYDFSVTTTDPNYGFDVYFVPSEREVESYRDTGEFSYYLGKGCSGENYLSFSGSCKGVAKESVLLVIMPEKLTESLATITVQLEEQGSTGIVDISTNKQEYRYEEIIQISGSVRRFEGDDSKLTVTILDPNGRIIDTNIISFAHDNLYAFTVKAKGTLWNKEGTYTIQAQYGSSTDIAEQTFEIINIKPEGIISTAPAIPSTSPSSYTESYKNTKFHFSIDYPSGWNVDDSDTGNLEDAIVSFADDPEYYRGLLNVFLYENNLEEANLSDKQYFDFLINDIETGCESATIKEIGYLCSNFKLMDSKLIEVDGKNAYQARYSWTETDADGQLWRVISLATDIPVGNDDWYIYAETLSETYEDYIGVLESSINSFKSIGTNAAPPPQKESTTQPQVPSWVKNTAKWWAEEKINDSDFSTGIEFLIKEKIIKITETKKSGSETVQKIPSWIKNNAGWWADNLITEDDFVKGIEYLVKVGIIRIQ